MAAHWLYMAAANRFPPGIHIGMGVNLLQALHFGLLTAVCWTGHQWNGDRRLPWLAGFGLVQVMLMVVTTAAIFVPSLLQAMIPRLLYPGLITLPMVMVAGVLLSARGEARVLRGPGLG